MTFGERTVVTEVEASKSREVGDTINSKTARWLATSSALPDTGCDLQG
jgi:hypothetical protein